MCTACVKSRCTSKYVFRPILGMIMIPRAGTSGRKSRIRIFSGTFKISSPDIDRNREALGQDDAGRPNLYIEFDNLTRLTASCHHGYETAGTAATFRGPVYDAKPEATPEPAVYEDQLCPGIQPLFHLATTPGPLQTDLHLSSTKTGRV